MKPLGWLFRQENLLPLVLGFSDGILTALILAAGLLTEGKKTVTPGIAVRIATGALISGAFVFFVAHYAELRRELIRAERELSLMSHGKLAASHLGRAVLGEAIFSALISSVAAFLGALVPLGLAALVPAYRWVSIIAALVTLALLGIGLARAVHGSVLRWSIGLAAGGGVLCIIGTYLKIVG